LSKADIVDWYSIVGIDSKPHVPHLLSWLEWETNSAISYLGSMVVMLLSFVEHAYFSTFLQACCAGQSIESERKINGYFTNAANRKLFIFARVNGINIILLIATFLYVETDELNCFSDIVVIVAFIVWACCFIGFYYSSYKISRNYVHNSPVEKKKRAEKPPTRLSQFKI